MRKTLARVKYELPARAQVRLAARGAGMMEYALLAAVAAALFGILYFVLAGNGSGGLIGDLLDKIKAGLSV